MRYNADGLPSKKGHFMKFSTISGVILDMDGVLWRGNTPLPGLAEWFGWLAEAQVPYVLATNNSSRTPFDYVAKLEQMGLSGIPPERIVTSGMATAAYLQKHYPAGTRIHVLGMAGLRTMIGDAGYDLSSEDEPPQVVVVGIDFELTYDALKQAVRYIRAGAEFIGTNPDKTFPLPDGLAPGAGSVIAAVEAATGRPPSVIIGKPNRPMFDTALDILGSTPDTTIMVGDRLDTDIIGAQNAGLKTVLVFSGVTTPDDLAVQGIWPDVAYEGLPELIRAWAGHEWYQDKLKAKRGR